MAREKSVSGFRWNDFPRDCDDEQYKMGWWKNEFMVNFFVLFLGGGFQKIYLKAGWMIM